MRFGGFGFNNQFGFGAAASQGGGGGGSTELFPDPTLADVADPAEWTFDGIGLAPTGGTGPGISFSSAGDGGSVSFTADSALATELIANTSPTTTYNVALTIANFAAASSESLFFILRDGAGSSFNPSGNGVINLSVTSGSAGADASFAISTSSGSGATFDITDISLTA